MENGKDFKRIVASIAQIIMHVDDQSPMFMVTGGTAIHAGSNSRERGINLGHWRAFGGCESGFGIPI